MTFKDEVLCSFALDLNDLGKKRMNIRTHVGVQKCIMVVEPGIYTRRLPGGERIMDIFLPGHM